MATASVSAGLPIRQAALISYLKLIDQKSHDEGAVKEPEQDLMKSAAKKTPKTPSGAGTTPKKKNAYRDSSPDSEYEEKPKNKGKKSAEPRDLFSLLGPPSALKTPKKAKPVRRNEYSDDDTESESAVDRREIQWFEGVATPEDMIIDKLIFRNGTYFIGKYKILHLVSACDEKGATYIASRNGYEVVLRVSFIQKDDMEMLNTETKFLEMMELNDVQHLFSTFFDMGMVNKERADGLVFYASLYRGGPTLAQCHALCGGKFSSPTVNRLATQLITIFEQICGAGYRILDFSLDDFTIDRRSRVLFLNNYSNIVKAEGIEDEEMIDITTMETKKRAAWEGDEDLAPVKWHLDEENHVMSETDSVESLIYLLVQLQQGPLPWRGQDNKVGYKVAHGTTSGGAASIINFVPPALKCLWWMVRSADLPKVSFSVIHQIFSRYTNDDEDYCYDWELDVEASDHQERLINLADHIGDTMRRMETMDCIIFNALSLAKDKEDAKEYEDKEDDEVIDNEDNEEEEVNDD